MGQRENALASYRRAVQLDPELDDTWEDLSSIEAEIKEEIEAQVSQILDKVEAHLENEAFGMALSECEAAIQVDPGCAIAYDYRGDIYAELGQRENALASYQKAVQLDPELSDAWKNLFTIEAEIEAEFEDSTARQHLDQALEYAYNDEPEKALAECESAKLSIPGIAIAYNDLGLVLQTAGQLELAIDAYLKAVELNPRFYPARENLANARVSWEEEEQDRSFLNLDPVEAPETIMEFDESQIPESDEPVPQWVYMDKKASILVGWAGHRTRPGRSGYDPLETDFELAHMEGVMIRLLLRGKFRTRNPLYLIFMACVGVLFSLSGALPFTLGDLNGMVAGIISSPYLVIGIALLINVYLSLQLENSGEDEDNGCTFF